jgi:hypothetical protein
MDSSGSSGQYVSYDDSILLEDIYTVSSDDALIIPVGPPGVRVSGAKSFRGDLLFRRPDGIYKLNNDRASASLVLDYRDQASTLNFQSWAEYNGELVYPVRDKLFRWNGVRATPVTPPPIEDTWPLIQYGNFNNFEVADKWLYMTAQTRADADNNYEEHLLAYDGAGWHALAPLCTDASSSVITALHYDPDNDYMWYGKDVGTDSDATIHYIPFQARTEMPYEQFTASTDDTASSRLRFPRIAAGYRTVYKSTPSVIMEGMNCNSGQYLELLFRTDASTAWLPWGADSGVSNVLTSDGVKAFDNPYGEEDSTVEYRYIEYAIDLVSSNSTGTPVLAGFYPRLLLRPESIWGWSFLITAAGGAQHGVTKSSKTPHNILADLKEDRDSKAPIDFEDIYGETYQIYITAMNEAAVEEHVGRAGEFPEVEQAVQVNLVEAA